MISEKGLIHVTGLGVYARALDELIVRQGLYQHCPGLGQYSYSFRESTNTLYFFFDTDVL